MNLGLFGTWGAGPWVCVGIFDILKLRSLRYRVSFWGFGARTGLGGSECGF